MHELSIALSVVEAVTESLKDEPGRVLSVRLRVGALSGVVSDALRFAWDIATNDTRLTGSALEIEDVDVHIWCDACDDERIITNDIMMVCPVCDSTATRITAGREMEIVSVEVEDS